MTVATVYAPKTYTCNGSTTVFSFPFLCLDAAHIVVTITVIATGASSTLVLESDYTVAGVGNQGGGSITTIATAYSSGFKLTISLAVPYVQQFHYVPNDPLPADTLESSFDLLTMQTGQLADLAGRSPHYPVGASYPADMPIPQQGYSLGWDAEGNLVPIAQGLGSGAALQADLASSTGGKGAALVAYLSPLAGAVVGNLYDKEQECVSVMDFMTSSQKARVRAFDTTLDSWAPMQAAINASRFVTVPPGLYMISRPLVMSYAKQAFMGASNGTSEIRPLAGFSSTTIGGLSSAGLIVYQPTAGNWYDQSGFIWGGVISNLTLNIGGAAVDGIVFNRVNQQQIVSNVHIYYPRVGINSTWCGFCHTYENVFVQDASSIGILLANGANGVAMLGCYIFGMDVLTPNLLVIDGDHYHGSQAMLGSSGNSYNGGAIQGGKVAIAINAGQCAFSGVDVEEITRNYALINGYFNPSYPTLQIAGPPTTFTGCQFIGTPNIGNHGVVVTGAIASFDGCMFWSQGAAPTLAKFTASISGNVMTLTSAATGTMAVGQILNSASLAYGVTIQSLASGSLGANGSTYNVTPSQGVIGSSPMQSASCYLFAGVLAGQQIGSLPAPCISEKDSTIIGWGYNLHAGFNGYGTAWTPAALGVLAPSTRHMGRLLSQGATMEAGTGIAFGASTAELTDYQVGTWTPTLNSWTTTGGLTNTGKYTKIGNVVYFSVHVQATTITTTTSSTVTGLPFAPASSGCCNSAAGDITPIGSLLVGTAASGTIYMIASTKNDIYITGSYFTS